MGLEYVDLPLNNTAFCLDLWQRIWGGSAVPKLQRRLRIHNCETVVIVVLPSP